MTDVKATLEKYCKDNAEEVKPTLKELECLKQFRSDHESDFIENNVRFNNRSDQIRREIERLNEKIAEEISNHRDLQHSDFIDHENDEFMIGPEHELHPANCNYQIQMKVNSPASSREDSSEEESTDESDEANED